MCFKNNKHKHENKDDDIPLNCTNEEEKNELVVTTTGSKSKSIWNYNNNNNNSSSSNSCIISIREILIHKIKKPSKRVLLIIILCFTLLNYINITTLPTIYNENNDKRYSTKISNNIIDTAYISTIKDKINIRPQSQFFDLPSSSSYYDEEETTTPNFYEILSNNYCNTIEKPIMTHACSKCLRKKTPNIGGNCNICDAVCECYCKYLCRIKPKTKFIKKILYVTPPLLTKNNNNRLIPRIIFQTWFENPTLYPNKYPNLSRIVESWKQSGYEYYFYNDDDAASFIKTHFPNEVLEAYNSIIPGSFKADLFRYCVLFIYGGVYADVDVMLQSNLDMVISPDVGFMIPFDEPGRDGGHGSCLWNGLIASAPSHPFLSHTIQLVVNNIRNRFTNIDIDNLLCSNDGNNPELGINHRLDILFTTGPCILGLAINQVLQRDPQRQFTDGDLYEYNDYQKRSNYKTIKHTITTATSSKSNIITIPGRSIILHQNKTDMGLHTFTMTYKNVIIASTDLHSSIKSMFLQNEDRPHYSKMHAKYGQIYGLGNNNVYIDQKKSNDIIEIVIVEHNTFYIWIQRVYKMILLNITSFSLFSKGFLIFGIILIVSSSFFHYWFCYKKYKLRFSACTTCAQ